MDPEFSRLVDEAANIAARGRWAAVNERIKHLAANPGADNDWWVQLFASLCSQVFSEYLFLKRAHEEKRDEASLLAWRARNLLELSVWCLYCSKSRENARRLYADAGRDVLGLSVLSQNGGRDGPRPRLARSVYGREARPFPTGCFGRDWVSGWALQES